MPNIWKKNSNEKKPEKSGNWEIGNDKAECKAEFLEKKYTKWSFPQIFTLIILITRLKK